MSSSEVLLRPNLATWVVKRPWVAVVGFALIPVLSLRWDLLSVKYSLLEIPEQLGLSRPLQRSQP